MSKLYLKIQQEILKELKETNGDDESQPPTETEPVDPIIELANDNQFISPILQILKSYIKELSKTPASTWSKLKNALSQKNPRAEEIKKKLKVSSPGVFSWLDFSREPNPFYALYLAYVHSDQKGNWNKVFGAEQELDNNIENIKTLANSDVAFIKYFFTGGISAISELADEVLDNSQFSIRTKNFVLHKGGENTLFYKELIKTIEVATKLTAIKKSDAKSNFASSYLPVLIKFQRVIDKQLARIEKERKDTKPENEPELNNNQKFLELSKKVVNFIKSFITNQPQQADQEQEPVQENIEQTERSEFERGDFNDLIEKLKEMDEFVPGVSQFFDKMEETDLELIMSDKEAQRKFNEAIRATLSTVGREIDAMAGLGKFSVSEKELKAILVKNKIENNHPMIINTTVKAFKGLSSQKTIAQFLELVVKNSAKYANQEKEQVKPDVQKAALEVLEGKHFKAIDDTVKLFGEPTPETYNKYESVIRAKLALFFDKPSSQLQLEILTDEYIFQFERPAADKTFESFKIAGVANDATKGGVESQLEEYKTKFEAFLKVPFILDFKGDTRIGVESGKKEIELYKFFNRKFDGYEDPESVSPINFILELVNQAMTRPYAGATIKLADREESGAAISPFDDVGKNIPQALQGLSQEPAKKVVANEWIKDLASSLEENKEEDFEEVIDDVADGLTPEQILEKTAQELAEFIAQNIPKDRLDTADAKDWRDSIRGKVEQIKNNANDLEKINKSEFANEYNTVVRNSNNWAQFIRSFMKLLFQDKYFDKGYTSLLGFLYKQYAPEMLGGGFLKEEEEQPINLKFKTVTKELKGLFTDIATKMQEFHDKEEENKDLKEITNDIYAQLKNFAENITHQQVSWDEFKQLSNKTVGDNQKEETEKLLSGIVEEITYQNIYDKMASLGKFFSSDIEYIPFFFEIFSQKLEQIKEEEEIKFYDTTNKKIDTVEKIIFYEGSSLKINQSEYDFLNDSSTALLNLFSSFSPEIINRTKEELSSISVFHKLADHFAGKLSNLKPMEIRPYMLAYNKYVEKIAKKFNDSFVVKSAKQPGKELSEKPSDIIKSYFLMRNSTVSIRSGGSYNLHHISKGGLESNQIENKENLLFIHVPERPEETYDFKILNNEFKEYLSKNAIYYFEEKKTDTQPISESNQKGISNLLENLVNNYINNRKQKWQKRTM
jgi:hypothetical protein